MKALASHVEKIVAGVLLVVCATVIVRALGPGENKAQADIKVAQKAIEEALQQNKAGVSFAYFPERQLSYADRLARYLSGADRISAAGSPSFAFYPQPERPEVVQKDPEDSRKKGTKPALLPAPEQLRVEGQQGLARISWKVPKTFEIFAPVSLELYRGTSEAKIDQRIISIDLEPEKRIDSKTGKNEAGEAEGESVAQEPLHATRRSMVRRSKPTVKAGGKAKVSAIPSSYDDQDVDENTTYVYRARLVGRLVGVNKDMSVLEGATLYEVSIPKTVEKLTDEQDAALALYGSSWSATAKTQVPSSIQMRLAGVMGDVPHTPDPAKPASGYSAYFCIQRWMKEKREWGEATVPIPVGKSIAGDPRFHVAGGGTEKKEVDLGMTLTAVRHATCVNYQKQMVSEMRDVVDPETQEVFRMPVLDAQGQPVMKERIVEIRVPTLVALLTEKATGLVHRYPRRKEFGPQQQGEMIFLDDEKLPVIESAPGTVKQEQTQPKPTPGSAPLKEQPGTAALSAGTSGAQEGRQVPGKTAVPSK